MGVKGGCCSRAIISQKEIAGGQGCKSHGGTAHKSWERQLGDGDAQRRPTGL